MTIIEILRRHGDVMAAVELARLARLAIEDCYLQLNEAEAHGLVRILPIDGNRGIMGWAAV